MKIVSSDFIRSCYQAEQFPRDRLPEVAFVGRSNVGKSSLINSLLNRKKLAKISRTPGKTRAINFFRVVALDRGRSAFYAVDLPGYGYARVAKSVRAQWGPMIEGYMTERPELRGIVFLLDSRGHESLDDSTLAWLRTLERPVVVVTTKIDKLTRSERAGTVAGIKEKLGLTAEEGPIAYSSVTHEGREVVWRVLREWVV